MSVDPAKEAYILVLAYILNRLINIVFKVTLLTGRCGISPLFSVEVNPWLQPCLLPERHNTMDLCDSSTKGDKELEILKVYNIFYLWEVVWSQLC